MSKRECVRLDEAEYLRAHILAERVINEDDPQKISIRLRCHCRQAECAKECEPSLDERLQGTLLHAGI